MQATGETCKWFLACENPASGERAHPILGLVPLRERCRELIGDNGGRSGNE